MVFCVRLSYTYPTTSDFTKWLIFLFLNILFLYYYTTLTDFGTKYLMICKVYTDVGGIR